MAYHGISHESLVCPFTPHHWKYNGQHTQGAAAANEGQVWCNTAIIQWFSSILIGWFFLIWHSVNINSTYSGSIMTCSWFSRTFKNTYLSMFGLGTEKKTWKKIRKLIHRRCTCIMKTVHNQVVLLEILEAGWSNSQGVGPKVVNSTVWFLLFPRFFP